MLSQREAGLCHLGAAVALYLFGCLFGFLSVGSQRRPLLVDCNCQACLGHLGTILTPYPLIVKAKLAYVIWKSSSPFPRFLLRPSLLMAFGAIVTLVFC